MFAKEPIFSLSGDSINVVVSNGLIFKSFNFKRFETHPSSKKEVYLAWYVKIFVKYCTLDLRRSVKKREKSCRISGAPEGLSVKINSCF